MLVGAGVRGVHMNKNMNTLLRGDVYTAERKNFNGTNRLVGGCKYEQTNKSLTGDLHKNRGDG